MNYFDTEHKEKRVGIYATLSFHLIVLIILLAVSIGVVWQSESTFVLDFTREDELVKQQHEVELKEQVRENLDQMFGAVEHSNVRNVAVDAGSKLKDDRFKNPSSIYEEARALQKKLDASKRDAMAEKAAEEAVDMSQNNAAEEDNTHQYSGPSVISWTLDGRKARALPVPAYKGYGAGDVYVQITVNQKGKVTSASVIKELSSPDASLHSYALEAAKRSRFSASDSAPQSQKGEIVYRFIAQ